MLPRHLNIEQGDKVVYHWRDPHNVHTVGFAAATSVYQCTVHDFMVATVNVTQ